MMSEKSRDTAAWMAIDLVLVAIFAGIGRASHAEALDPWGILTTAWPFLVGCLAGQLIAVAWRRPVSLWPTGVIVWVSTVLVGMVLRILTDAGTATAFVIVATLTLAAFLLGWRVIMLIVRHLVRQRA